MSASSSEPARDRAPRVLLGVCGGVAAYKAVLLLRRLQDLGIEVRVILTESAKRFVGEATFHALLGAAPYQELWRLGESRSGELHVELGAWADVMVVYPATARVLGSLAAGITDELLTLSATCCKGPVLLCPAMHHRMQAQPARAQAEKSLKDAGFHVLPPVIGRLASGELGEGRLPEPEAALEAVRALLAPQDLAGRTILVTAGPTREHIDPVRFLSNPSSGRMGFALARVAARRGARVLLISGPVPRELGPGPMPANVERIDVVSARQMAEAVHSHVSKADAVVMSAAVADFSPAEVAAEKVKKTDAALELPLEPTEDILATLGARRAAAASLRPLLVGFAMETSQLLPRAKEKLERKGLDLLVANDLTVEGAGFGTETNVVSILHRHGGVDSLPKMDKEAVAGAILDRVVALLAAARMQ